MIYYHIIKKELNNGVIIDTPIGYVTSQEDADYINNIHNGNDYNDWINNNVNDLQNGIKFIEDYFNINPIIYMFMSSTNYIEGYNNILITDLDNLE